MPKDAAIECNEPRWLRALDHLGYLGRIASRRWHLLISLAIVGALLAIALVLPASEVEKLIKDPRNAGILSLILVLVNIPKPTEMVVDGLRHLFRSRDKANGPYAKQVNRSVKRHVALMRIVEDIRSATSGMILSARRKEEEEVVRRALKLADSVVRERLRLHERDDVHLTLRVWKDDVARLFYEREEGSRRGRHDIGVAHDALFACEPCDAVNLFYERYTFRHWANLKSRRHVRRLDLPPNLADCGCRSALLIFLQSEPQTALLIESRRPYEFGNERRNRQIVEQMIPFFVMLRLALQYRVPPDAKVRRPRRRKAESGRPVQPA